jgi:hypothetical protein
MRNRAQATTIPGWQPPRITVTTILIRTTARSHVEHGAQPADPSAAPAGHPLGVAAGAAASPAAALEEMRKHAHELATSHAQRLTRQHRSEAELSVRAGQEPRRYEYYGFPDDDGRWVSDSCELSCEVIDVRMSSSVAGGRPSWLAYGTLIARDPDPAHNARAYSKAGAPA